MRVVGAGTRHARYVTFPYPPIRASTGHRIAARRDARVSPLAVRMYALILAAATPFVLLATVMGLSWWEDHVLPSPTPIEEALIEAGNAPPAPPGRPRPSGVHEPLTHQVARR